MDSLVEVDHIIVEEQGILSIISKVLRLHIPSSLLFIVCIVIELGLEVVLCLLIPVCMTEETSLGHQEYGWS